MIELVYSKISTELYAKKNNFTVPRLIKNCLIIDLLANHPAPITMQNYNVPDIPR